MNAETSFKTFELNNNIQSVDANDALYIYDERAHKLEVEKKLWKKDPNYFKHVKISAVALIKMVMHARSGGSIEVMGLMQGKIRGDTLIVMDSFALPVEGTETRVNAQSEAYEYMVQYTTSSEAVGRKENVIGWYHSHPGYGCWLSGIDVNTQMLNQQFNEPWVAIVIDPNRTISAGKVDIGAFRTYPAEYKSMDQGPSEYQSIPLSKIEDFGVHAKSYYQLEISHFKSSLDGHLLELLWNKYWVKTLSQSPLMTNRGYLSAQMADLTEKLEQAESMMTQCGRMGITWDANGKKVESKLARATRDSSKIGVECAHGLISQVLKDYLFNTGMSKLPSAKVLAAID